MAYAPPTRATFIGLFPVFAAVTDAQYTFWAAQAVLVTEPLEGCLASRMDLATMLVTAHLLTLQGIGTGAEAEMAAQGASGFRRIKSGTLELERGESSGDASAGSYGATSYGQQAWPMLKACLAGPRVSATGNPMCCGPSGYQGTIW